MLIHSHGFVLVALWSYGWTPVIHLFIKSPRVGGPCLVPTAPILLQLPVARHSVQTPQSQTRDRDSYQARKDVFDKGRLLFLLLPGRSRKGLEVKDRGDRSRRRPSLNQAARGRRSRCCRREACGFFLPLVKNGFFGRIFVDTSYIILRPRRT
jgi:hypothetical protein